MSSKNETEVTKPGQTITDSNGNIWGLDQTQGAGYKVTRNHIIQTATSEVILLLYYNNIIYYENNVHQWYYYNSGSWIKTTNPIVINTIKINLSSPTKKVKM